MAYIMEKYACFGGASTNFAGSRESLARQGAIGHRGRMSVSLFGHVVRFGFDRVGVVVDPLLIRMLRRHHFPAARLLAAAEASYGDADLFRSGLPPAQARRFDRLLGRKAYQAARDACVASEAATEAWRDIMVSGVAGDPAQAEMERRRAATRRLATATALLTALGRRDLPLVQWGMQPPAEHWPPGAADFSAPDDFMTVDAGPVYREGVLYRQWLYAPAETGLLGDRAWARASWPAEGPVIGACVVGSGVGVEWDIYVRPRSDYDFSATFAGHGIAAIELVSPGHGLRRAVGRYGGESFFEGAPVSVGALLAAQVRESARWIAWARRRFERPVGIFGVSMSSFAAQLALTHAISWPATARPDAGFLLAHSGDLPGVVSGPLARALGIPAAFEAHGWDDAALAPWRSALGPGRAAAVPGARILSVIGRHDAVTPYRDGLAIAELWGLPPENCFRWPHGHFGLPMRLGLDDRPFARFAKVLAGA